jgi:hypothetical protein
MGRYVGFATISLLNSRDWKMKKTEFDFLRYVVCCIMAICADMTTMLGLFVCVLIAVFISTFGLGYALYAIPVFLYVAYLMARGYGYYVLSQGGVEERFAARKQHPFITYGINK